MERFRLSWMSVRIDASNSSTGVRRHAHISKTRDIPNKDRQASWNDNKSRHDKKTFNDKVGSLSTVKKIARKALKLDNDAFLESVSPAGKLLHQMDSLILENSNHDNRFEHEKIFLLKLISE